MPRRHALTLALALSLWPLAAFADAPDGAQARACEADRGADGCAEVLTRLFVCRAASAMAGCADFLAAHEAAAADVEEPADSPPATLAGTIIQPGTTMEDPMHSCAVLDSRDWLAVLHTGGAAPTLVASGTITLPTPGYTVRFEAGIADRSARPFQHFDLTTTPPPASLSVMQVLTDIDIRAETPGLAPIDGAAPYRGVRIVCGGEIIAEITTVSLAD